MYDGKNGAMKLKGLFLFSIAFAFMLLSVSQVYAACGDGDTAGMVAYWQGEGNANDGKGSYNGVANGNVAYLPGKVGQAFDFDGASYLSLPTFTQWTILPGCGYTIEVWAKPTVNNAPGYGRSYIMDAAGNGRFGLHVQYDQWGYDVGSTWYGGMFPAEFGAWHHIVMVVSSSCTVTLYDNGVARGSGGGSNGMTSSCNANIGASNSNGVMTDPFVGQIDELAVYNRALSGAEILAHYDRTKGGSQDYCGRVAGAPPEPAECSADSEGLGANLKLWVAADDAGTITKDGSNRVSQWNDKSGIGNNFAQGDYNKQPTYVTNILNGKPAVRVANPQTMFTTTNFPAPVTVIYIGRLTGGSDNRMLAGYNNNWLLGYHGGVMNRAYFEGWVTTDGGVSPDTNFHIFSAIIPGPGQNSKAYKDGTLLAENQNGVTGPNGLALSGYSQATSELSNGDIAEVIVYNKALSDTERKKVESYLAGKYSISGPEQVSCLPPKIIATVTPAQAGQNKPFTVNSTVTCNNSAGCGTLTATLYVNMKESLTKMYSRVGYQAPLDSGTDISAEISKVLASDDVRVSTSGPLGDYEGQAFTFSGVNLNANKLTIRWEGYQATNYYTSGQMIYIYNYLSNNWYQLNTVGFFNGESTWTATICSSGCSYALNPADFISSDGKATVMVQAHYDNPPQTCPFLYSWNGTSYTTVRDFGAIAELPKWPRPMYTTLVPEDLTRIDESQLSLKNGLISLKVTEEYPEASYIDMLKLIAVDHPAGLDVYAHHEQADCYHCLPSFYAVDESNNLINSVVTSKGKDITEEVRDSDYVYSKTGAILGEPYIELNLPSLSGYDEITMLVDGYTVADWSLAGESWVNPKLEVKNNAGEWVEVPNYPLNNKSSVRYPYSSGVQYPVAFNLTGKFLTNDYKLRVYWGFEVNLDSIGVYGTNSNQINYSTIDPIIANLGYKGPSIWSKPAVNATILPVYGQLMDNYSNIYTLSGNFTRYGDVSPLLSEVDDKFVITARGDEISLEFNPADLPAVPQGMERTYFLYAWSYYKPGSESNSLEPLPFKDMSTYPYYAPAHYPNDAEHILYQSTYNTRYINSTSGHKTMYTDYVSLVSEPSILVQVPSSGSFYTTSSNPQTSTNTACLANLANGQSCTVSWNTRAANVGSYGIFVTYTSTVLPSFNTSTATASIFEVACETGETRSCYTGPAGTAGVGICQAGTQACDSGVWGACTGELKPQTETCNNVDDDCNGAVDNIAESDRPSCTKTAGVCSGTKKTCNAGNWIDCSAADYLAYSSYYRVAENTGDVCWDSYDNDCNNQADSTEEKCQPGGVPLQPCTVQQMEDLNGDNTIDSFDALLLLRTIILFDNNVVGTKECQAVVLGA